MRKLNQKNKNIIFTEMASRSRILFDLTGPSYTIVWEMTYANLAASEMSGGMNESQWRDWYQRFIPIIDSSYKEILTIVY